MRYLTSRREIPSKKTQSSSRNGMKTWRVDSGHSGDVMPNQSIV
jgi:hypothetical protein